VGFATSRERQSLLVIFRRALHRRRTRWFGTAFIAILATLFTMTTISAANSAKHSWGTTREVVVATHDLEPGTTVRVQDTRSEQRPIALVAEDATTDVIGRTVTAFIAAGETFTKRRVAPSGDSGPGALLGPNSLAFAVPTNNTTPSLSIGDRVDVFAPGSAAKTLSVPVAIRLAHRAVVISVDDQRTMISVDAMQAPAVARALLDTTVILALAG